MDKELEALSVEEARRQLEELGKLYPVAARERIYRLACHVSEQISREWLE